MCVSPLDDFSLFLALQVCQQSGVLGESSGYGGGRSPRHPAAFLVEGGDHVVVEQQGQQAIQEIPGALAALDWGTTGRIFDDVPSGKLK